MFTYTADANGYMLFYKGQPLGGVGVKLPRSKPLHWKHARANAKENNEQAKREIAELESGAGQSRYRNVINGIDGVSVTP